MARNYTSIDHSALSSDTLAEANDATQAMFWRLLCVSDDWGRFPNNPVKLKREMKDFTHTPEQIRDAIDHFIKHASLLVYEVADLSICEWVKWDQFQTMKFKNGAQYPNRDGILEGSINPLSRAEKKQNRTYHSITEHNINKDDALVNTYATHKAKHRSQHKTEKVNGEVGINKNGKEKEIPQRFEDAVRAIFPRVPDDRLIPQAETLEEIERLDRFVDTGQPITLDELLPALIWAAGDEFWSANFKSCAGLRKRRDGAGSPTKWEKIYARYQQVEPQTQGGDIDF